MFENAIACLRHDGDGDFWTAPKGEQEAAIRLLEAAGKVDKTEADIWLLNARWAECDTAHDCGMRGVVRGLISALPDAPKEEK